MLEMRNKSDAHVPQLISSNWPWSSWRLQILCSKIYCCRQKQCVFCQTFGFY